jgi:16S rRNA G527 N7-methylase RsmG
MSLIDEIEKAKEKQALKDKFYQALESLEKEKTANKTSNSKAKDSRIYKFDQYSQLLKEIDEAHKLTTTKSNRQYYLTKHYEVLKVGETQKIIKKREKDTDL